MHSNKNFKSGHCFLIRNVMTACAMTLLVSISALAQSQPRELSGKVALITGASANLGRGYAVGLAQKGADVVIHYYQLEDKSDAEETARLVRNEGTKAILVQGDLCEMKTITLLFDETIKAFGKVDIVINNAGKIIKKPISEITEQDYESVFCVNSKASFFMMKEASKRISDNGRIINILSSLIGSVRGEYSVYAGSKASVEQFTRALAREIGSRGVTVNAVAPGPIDTPFFSKPETKESIAGASRLSVAGRLGQVSDIVPLIQFLASPGSQWITAQTIYINGGYITR